MKSFDKFQYGRTDLHELKIGEYARGAVNKVSSAANKVKTALQRRSNTIPERGAMGAKMRRSPELKRKAIEQQRIDAQKAINKNPNLRVGQPIKSKNPTPKPNNKVTSIIKRTDNTVKKFKPKSGIQQVMDRTKKNIKKKAESQAGRATGRAFAGASKAILNYKPDRERTDTGQGGMGTAQRQAGGFLKSAIKGAVDSPAERINPKQRKTLGGKLLAIGKERAQDRIGIEPTARTGQGRKLTGGTSRKTDRERSDQIASSVAKSGQKSKEDALSYIQSAPTSTQLSGVSDKDLSKTKKTGDENQFKSNETKTDQTSKVTSDADRNPDLVGRMQMGVYGDDSNTSSADTVISKSNTSSTRRQANQTRIRRPNIRSYKNDPEGYKKARAAYAAQSPENKTRPGGGRRPRTRTEGTMNLSKILEANRIAAEREIKNQYGSVANAQMRTPAQMKADKFKKKILQNKNSAMTNNESYSHWREEFIWETDKKYPDKVKEIKPMSGKNTITINPEDDTSKYKRGY